MGNIRLNLGARAAVFALGMALIMAVIGIIVMSAADIIARGITYFDAGYYVSSISLLSGMLGGIGGLFVFVGWKAEKPLDDSQDTGPFDE